LNKIFSSCFGYFQCSAGFFLPFNAERAYLAIVFMEYKHVSVMLSEALDFLRPEKGGYFIDCTLGGAGYTSALSEKVGAEGGILAIDLDPEAIANARKKNFKNIALAQGSFSDLKEIAAKEFPAGTLFDGIVMDLGLSSFQLADPKRGFSFLQSGPLDMSFEGRGAERSTAYIVNNYKEDRLRDIIRLWGEEKFAARIAKRIIEERKKEPIGDSVRLAEIIAAAMPPLTRRGGINPATKTFQALRLETNREIEALEKVLPTATSLLKKGGRLVIVSFHSLEDRVVKNFFKKESRECVCPPSFPVCRCGHEASLKILTKKPVVPSEEEIKNNPRSRSAKLRAAEKI
jgi:16S rRNA (cytosine1402-N4)-methyltransferase